MKSTIKIIFLLLAASGCHEDEKGPYDGMGCMTGVYKGGSSDRVSMGCHTHKTFLAGNNVAAGGLPYAGNYTQVRWEQVDDCSECK